ncbi:hypothetical protein [Desertivibrio insolitus]|uniref:hypothetical protein n=1 Tax=Herbiconiux sp. SYSU D00978 TaxID=2812562 RepID=UPI001A95C379|nr:hypothetical protein [Herbiconiux sp. SYSU D00978]
MKQKLGVAAAAIAVGLALAPAAPAVAATTATIEVPTDFVPDRSDTRATGHYEVVGTGLRLWTEGSASSDKVAEYVATNTALTAVGEPTLEYSNTSGGVPGFQLVVDFDADGNDDGILIGEPGVYGNDWWLNNAAEEFVKDGAPSHTGGYGSANHGTLDQWRTAFPEAKVIAFGFSLGSGVKGDGILNAINFAGTRYTFRAPAAVVPAVPSAEADISCGKVELTLGNVTAQPGTTVNEAASFQFVVDDQPAGSADIAADGTASKVFEFAEDTGTHAVSVLSGGAVILSFAVESDCLPTVLKSKDECKQDGWKTSTAPVFKNQGECVSSFASAKKS